MTKHRLHPIAEGRKSNPISLRSPAASLPLSFFSPIEAQDDFQIQTLFGQLARSHAPFETNSFSAAQSAARMETDLRTQFFYPPPPSSSVQEKQQDKEISHLSPIPLRPSLSPSFSHMSVRPASVLLVPLLRLSQTFLAVRENWPL